MSGFPNFDPTWTVHVAELCTDSYAEFLTIPPDDLTQIDYVLAADAALDCAFVIYALGADLDEVRLWLSRAAYLLSQVFALRGTTPRMPVAVTDELGELHDVTPSGPDQSLTNSRRGLLAMQTALVAGDRELADQTAELVGDPPDASYIGPDSEVCMPDEQSVAYALKALLLEQTAVAVYHMGGVSNDAPPLEKQQAVALYALIDRDRDAFLEALDRLLDAQAAEAAEREAAREPRRFMCLPALALARLAIDDGLGTLDHLPASSIYLPLDLLTPG